MNVVEKSNNEDESVVWLKDELRKKGEEGEEREREYNMTWFVYLDC